MELGRKRWLITGITGSFGTAFAHHIIDHFDPICVRGYSRDELKQSSMEINLPGIDYLLGDVRDLDRLTMAAKGIDIIVHAAAYKRIEKGERDPEEFIKTNVLGSIHVAKAALAERVEKAVLISTDKASHPVNTYGKSKSLAEAYWVSANAYAGGKPPIFVAVRYGNVSGSRGSVIPYFTSLPKDEPFPVTDPEATRFWMTLKDACGLVEDVLVHGYRGDIFIPKCTSYTIKDLCLAIDPDRGMKTIGMRPGEKKHEQLVGLEECSRVIERVNHYVITPENPSWAYPSIIAHKHTVRFPISSFRRIITSPEINFKLREAGYL